MSFAAQFKRISFPKYLIASIVLACCFVVLTSHTYAQEPAQTTQPSELEQYVTPNTNADVPKNLHTMTQSVFTEVSAAMICQLIGIDVVNPNAQCLGIDRETGKLGFVQNGGGMIGLAMGGIAMTMNSPFHTSDYIQYMAQDFGIAKKANAQTTCNTGIGFCSLSPLVGAWRSILNITYMLFIIGFVAVGVGIMLRIKIDPRTVMTVENHIPKLIIGLVLVTLSLPLVGLLIDGMWIFTYASVNMLAGADPKISPSIVNQQINESPVAFVNEFYKDTPVTVGLPLGNQVNAPQEVGGGVLRLTTQSALDVQRIFASLLNPKNFKELLSPALDGQANIDKKCGVLDVGCRIGGFGGDVILGTLGNLISAILGFTLSWIFGIIGFLFILIAILWGMIRLWFELIKAYVRILIHVILGPLWIVGGVFPGSPVNFSSWFREIVGELTVFPTTIIMFGLGKIIMDAVSTSNGQLFVPPLIGNPNSQAFGSIMGLAIILLTPQVVAMIKDAFKSPQLKYGGAIGQAIGVGPKIGGSVWNAVSSPYGLLAGWERAKTFGNTFHGVISKVVSMGGARGGAAAAGGTQGVSQPGEPGSGGGASH